MSDDNTSRNSGKRSSGHCSKSVKSSYKTRSVASSSSSILKKKAEAERARASVEYAKKEAVIMKQCVRIQENQQLTLAHSTREKADLEAELTILRRERDVAIAEAEVRVLESAGALGYRKTSS